MIFRRNGSKIECIRLAQQADGTRLDEHLVAAFDAHLDAVAPHVAAALLPEERTQLEEYLDQARAFTSRSHADTVLACLPGLLDHAATIMTGGARPDDATVRRLHESIDSLETALEGDDDGDAPIPVQLPPGLAAGLRQLSDQL